MGSLRCWLMGHVWETILTRDRFGCSEWLRCVRCGFVPAFPLGGYELCHDVSHRSDQAT